MFVDRRQHANAKYGRDQCLACHRKLGLGYGASAKIFGCNKSTIALIGQNRLTEPRYEGFDLEWQRNRGLRFSRIVADARPRKDSKMEEAMRVFHQIWMDEIRAAVRAEASYDANYRRKFRHWRESDRARKASERKRFRDLNPARYRENRDRERVAMYLRRGIPEDQIPARMSVPATRVELAELQKIRKKRDYLRRKVREVWRGRLPNFAAFRILGCSVEDFRAYVISKLDPRWDESDYGLLWNFDHIKPLALFDVFDPEQCREANHWTNLRPMCWRENSAKGPRWADPEILESLISPE